MVPIPKSSSIAILLAALVTAACTEALPQEPAGDATLHQALVPVACPLGVDGASVAFVETPGGAALVFRAPPARVHEMWGRAREVAATRGLQAMQLPPARATVAESEDGARIELTPAAAADRDTLRARVEARALAMMAPCNDR